MNKGLSQLVVVVFLMLIGISLTAAAYFWSQDVIFTIYPNETQNNAYMRQRACLNIQDINDTHVTIDNCGSVPLDRFYLYINDTKRSVVIPKLNPGEKHEIFVSENGMNSVYVTSDYAESPAMTHTFTTPCTSCCVDTVDQQQQSSQLGSRFYSSAQSFTPTCSKLSKVSLYLQFTNPATVLLKIIPATVSGSPDIQNVLISKSVNIPAGNSWRDFDIDDILITPGQKYFILVSLPTSSTKLAFGIGTSYVGGVLWEGVTEAGLVPGSYDAMFVTYS